MLGKVRLPFRALLRRGAGVQFQLFLDPRAQGVAQGLNVLSLFEHRPGPSNVMGRLFLLSVLTTRGRFGSRVVGRKDARAIRTPPLPSAPISDRTRIV